MSREGVIVVLLLVTMLVGVVVQNVQANEGQWPYEVRVEAINVEGDMPKIMISDASRRLVYHCRMMVVESLTIAKLTVNVLFDVAIDVID